MFQPIDFIRVTIYLVALPTILAEVTVFTRGPGEETYCQCFNPLILSGSLFTLRPLPQNISRGHYSSYKFNCLFWLVSRPLLTLPLNFCHDIGNIYKRKDMQVYRFFIIIKIWSYLFLNQPGCADQPCIFLGRW